MDKLMDKPWFIKILALALAVLLYNSVPHPGSNSNDVDIPSDTSTATIQKVPVKVWFDTKNLVVTGIPDTVDITIKGPIQHVQAAKTLRNFEIYADLTNAKIGYQRVKLKIKDLSDKLQVTIKPATVNVNVQEKISKDFKVESEFINGLVEEGYTAGTPVVEPNKVKITGAKDMIDRIAYVKAAVVGKNPLTTSISQDARVQVLDREMNKLDVSVEPQTVRVTIPIKYTSKEVPITITSTGLPPAGISIDSINLDVDKAVISGNESVLKKTDNVRVEVDLSTINDNTTLTLPVIVPTGIRKATPETVKATIVVKKAEETTISGVPLKIKGLSDQYKATINDPLSKLVNLFITGPGSTINSLKPDDFNVFIDLSDLGEGNHDVNIHVEGPKNVDWQLDSATANVTINHT